jgi:hypothetical protein
VIFLRIDLTINNVLFCMLASFLSNIPAVQLGVQDLRKFNKRGEIAHLNIQKETFAPEVSAIEKLKTGKANLIEKRKGLLEGWHAVG